MTAQNKPLKEEEKKEEPKEEMVEVSKSSLDEMMKRMERLEAVANKGRLANFDGNQDDDTETIIRLRSLDNKIIKSWKTISNRVERDPLTKRIIEDQKLEIEFFDKSKIVMDIVTFTKRFKHVPCKVIERTMLQKKEDIMKYGIEKFKLETADGVEYIIGSTFVN